MSKCSPRGEIEQLSISVQIQITAGDLLDRKTLVHSELTERGRFSVREIDDVLDALLPIVRTAAAHKLQRLRAELNRRAADIAAEHIEAAS